MGSGDGLAGMVIVSVVDSSGAPRLVLALSAATCRVMVSGIERADVDRAVRDIAEALLKSVEAGGGDE